MIEGIQDFLRTEHFSNADKENLISQIIHLAKPSFIERFIGTGEFTEEQKKIAYPITLLSLITFILGGGGYIFFQSQNQAIFDDLKNQFGILKNLSSLLITFGWYLETVPLTEIVAYTWEHKDKSKAMKIRKDLFLQSFSLIGLYHTIAELIPTPITAFAERDFFDFVVGIALIPPSYVTGKTIAIEGIKGFIKGKKLLQKRFVK